MTCAEESSSSLVLNFSVTALPLEKVLYTAYPTARDTMRTMMTSIFRQVLLLNMIFFSQFKLPVRIEKNTLN